MFPCRSPAATPFSSWASSSRSLSPQLAGMEGTVVTSGMSEGIADEMSQVMELLKMDQAQLLDFLSGQIPQLVSPAGGHGVCHTRQIAQQVPLNVAG